MIFMKKRANLIGNRSNIVKKANRFYSSFNQRSKLRRCCPFTLKSMSVPTHQDYINVSKLKEIEKFIRCPNKQRELYKKEQEAILIRSIKKTHGEYYYSLSGAEFKIDISGSNLGYMAPKASGGEYVVYYHRIGSKKGDASFLTELAIGNELYQNGELIGTVTNIVSNSVFDMSGNIVNIEHTNNDINNIDIQTDDYILNTFNIEKQTIIDDKMKEYDDRIAMQYHNKCCSCDPADRDKTKPCTHFTKVEIQPISDYQMYMEVRLKCYLYAQKKFPDIIRSVSCGGDAGGSGIIAATARTRSCD